MKNCHFIKKLSVLVEFIQGVSQFSVKGDKLSKLRFAFRIYDMDNDGFISNGELFQVKIIIAFKNFYRAIKNKLFYWQCNILH